MFLETSIGAVIRYNPPTPVKEPEFLILKNRRGSWGFPQGHKELGESELDTLIREVREETGIRFLDVMSFIGTIRYSYMKLNGIRSHKEVKFYFATTPTRDIVISYEHASYRWVSFLSALNILAHRQLKSILIRGHRTGLY
ncbi:MAG: NUDIX domain-containing protein [Nitrosopumilales archaeon]|nr:MAG: NUDIX domain-containing protein [Nitrosopumilales archaeon]